MNKIGISKIDERLPLEKINRNKVEGFVKYFRQRQGHLKKFLSASSARSTPNRNLTKYRN